MNIKARVTNVKKIKPPDESMFSSSSEPAGYHAGQSVYWRMSGEGGEWCKGKLLRVNVDGVLVETAPCCRVGLDFKDIKPA